MSDATTRILLQKILEELRAIRALLEKARKG